MENVERKVTGRHHCVAQAILFACVQSLGAAFEQNITPLSVCRQIPAGGSMGDSDHLVIV